MYSLLQIMVLSYVQSSQLQLYTTAGSLVQSPASLATNKEIEWYKILEMREELGMGPDIKL